MLDGRLIDKLVSVNVPLYVINLSERDEQDKVGGILNHSHEPWGGIQVCCSSHACHPGINATVAK